MAVKQSKGVVWFIRYRMPGGGAAQTLGPLSDRRQVTTHSLVLRHYGAKIVKSFWLPELPAVHVRRRAY